MQYKGMNFCDFCFTPVNPDEVCPKCGLTHETYKAEAGVLLPGTNLLGKYIIGRVLGRGGFGVTYLAYSGELDKPVAIKEYYPTDITNRTKGEEKIVIMSEENRLLFEKGANRLFEEAKTIARFNANKNIVSAYEFFYANDTVYYSMEYLDGIDLKGYVAEKGGKIGEAEAVRIMRSVCDALVAVHSTQTLHGDLSPDNIFICKNGDVKLIDFGSSKRVIGDVQQEYSIVVKEGFAPAEQYKSGGQLGAWTDVYAAGASIYYAVTGAAPTDSMNRVENPEIMFDSALNLSPQFVNIIRKCLQIRIEDRYLSAIEVLGALEKVNVPKVEIFETEQVTSVENEEPTDIKIETPISNEAVSVEVPLEVTMESNSVENPQVAPAITVADIHPPEEMKVAPAITVADIHPPEEMKVAPAVTVADIHPPEEMKVAPAITVADIHPPEEMKVAPAVTVADVYQPETLQQEQPIGQKVEKKKSGWLKWVLIGGGILLTLAAIGVVLYLVLWNQEPKLPDGIPEIPQLQDVPEIPEGIFPMK